MRSLFSSITILIVLGLCSTLQAQELDASITIHSERLEPTYQNALQTLGEDLEQYINSYDYSDNTYNTKIPMIVEVYVQQASESGSEISFSAQLLVTNGTDQRYFDKSWEFPYSAGQMFQHGIYHPVTGVLDFYAYILLAGEVDTYAKLGGTPYYNNALEVATQGQSSGYGSGWRSRMQRLDDLQNHRNLRLVRYTFFDAYWDYQEGNAEDAQSGFDRTLSLLEEIFNRSRDDKYTKIFLDGNAEKISWLGNQLKRDAALQQLAKMDPDNEDIYLSKIQ